MMSSRDRADFRADGLSEQRRRAFRRGRAVHEMTFAEYLRFCESMARLFPNARRPDRTRDRRDFRL